MPFQYFLGLGCHIGSRFYLWSVESSPNVLFKMLEYPVINLTSTSFNFVSAIRFIKFCSSRNLKPLFFFPRGTELYLDLADGFWKSAYFLVQYWLAGLLSNFRFIFKKDKFRSIPDGFVSIRRYPDFLIFLGLTERTQRLAAADSRTSRMPSVGLNDVDAGPAMFTYSIFSNSKSFVNAYHFYKLFSRAVLDGSKFFTRVIATRIFGFYRNYLANIFVNPVQRAYFSELFSARKLKYPVAPVPFLFNVYKSARTFFLSSPKLFLAQFSYSVLVSGFPGSKFFGKLVYSEKDKSLQHFPVSPYKFYIFRRTLPFYRIVSYSPSGNERKNAMFLLNFEIQRMRPRRRRFPFPTSKIRKFAAFRKYKKRKINKLGSNGNYTLRFLRSKRKNFSEFLYNGFNALSSYMF